MNFTERHAELNAAVDQAQGTYDRKRGQVERAARYVDECPDGDRRKPEAEQRLDQLLAEMHAAERAAGDAADALIAFENTHGAPVDDSAFGYTWGEDVR